MLLLQMHSSPCRSRGLRNTVQRLARSHDQRDRNALYKERENVQTLMIAIFLKRVCSACVCLFVEERRHACDGAEAHAAL
jgi:hypothetical protein